MVWLYALILLLLAVALWGAYRVLALVNDRGPYVPGRVLDLSHADEVALGGFGLGQVSAQVVVPA